MTYSNKEIEEKLKNAITYATPNVLEQVLLKCEDRKGEVIKMTEPIKRTSKNRLIYRLGAIAAAFIMVLGGSFGYMQYLNSDNIDSIVGFDVNPSIELAVNKAEKVVGVTPLNEDAVVIIGEMDFKGANLNVAVNAIIGSMLEKGYISQIKNSVLITVENSDAAKTTKLEEKLAKEVEKLLSDKSVEAAILTQSANADEKLKKLADDNKISIGKAKLISAIIEQDGKQNFADLSKLTINELNLLVESKKIKIGDAAQKGTASEKAYIGAEKAKAIALADAKVAGAKNVTVEMDYEGGKMVYEVDFQAATTEYDYEIDATTGTIVFSHTETIIPGKVPTEEEAEKEKEIAEEKAEAQKEKEEAEKEAAKDKAEIEKDKADTAKEIAEEKAEAEKEKAEKEKAQQLEEKAAEKAKDEKEAADELLKKEQEAKDEAAEIEAEKAKDAQEAADEQAKEEPETPEAKEEPESTQENPEPKTQIAEEKTPQAEEEKDKTDTAEEEETEEEPKV